jgi:hypothetical protein
MLTTVTEQKIVVGNEIRELRTRINNHLDKLQDDLMKELTETENQITDETRDRSATISWACLSFFLAKVNSQGFDSTITSPNF